MILTSLAAAIVVGLGFAPPAEQNRPPWSSGKNDSGLPLHMRSVSDNFWSGSSWPADGYAAFVKFYAFSRQVGGKPGPPTTITAHCTDIPSGMAREDWVIYRGSQKTGYDFVAWYRCWPKYMTRCEPDWDSVEDYVEVIDSGPAAGSANSVPLRVFWPDSPTVTKPTHRRLCAAPAYPKLYSASELAAWSGGELFKFGVHGDNKSPDDVVALCHKRDEKSPLDVWYVFSGFGSESYWLALVYARSGGPVEPRYDAATRRFSLCPKSGGAPEVSAIVR